MARCLLCGTPIVGRYASAKYCGDKCRRTASSRRQRDDEGTEEGRLEVRRRLAAAGRVERRCRCSSPIGLVDEDGAARCFRCGWSLAQERVGELPPAA
jgi:hypothetical protein